jgi:hypothetical protein
MGASRRTSEPPKTAGEEAIMLIQKTTALVVLATSLFAMGCGSAPNSTEPTEMPDSTEPAEMPDDFKIVARYKAGWDAAQPWEYIITADGNVAQKIGPVGPERTLSEKRTELSKDDVKALFAKVVEMHFFTLRDRYKPERVWDLDTLVLEITMGQNTHKVLVYAHEFQPKDDQNDVDRFLCVWSEVLRMVPGPNPNQVPDWYKPGNYRDRLKSGKLAN